MFSILFDNIASKITIRIKRINIPPIRINKPNRIDIAVEMGGDIRIFIRPWVNGQPMSNCTPQKPRTKVVIPGFPIALLAYELIPLIIAYRLLIGYQFVIGRLVDVLDGISIGIPE